MHTCVLYLQERGLRAANEDGHSNARRVLVHVDTLHKPAKKGVPACFFFGASGVASIPRNASEAAVASSGKPRGCVSK